jgi:hypothetical protein
MFRKIQAAFARAVSVFSEDLPDARIRRRKPSTAEAKRFASVVPRALDGCDMSNNDGTTSPE